MSSLPFDLLRSSSGFSRDPRFCSLLATERQVEPAEAAIDAAADAYERGLADGQAQALAAALQAERDRDAQRAAIEISFTQLDDHLAADLRERLRQTVLALCEETVLPMAIDLNGLCARIDKAVAMLQRVDDERRVLLNPDDYALVKDRLPAGLKVEPEASIERGGLRIETPDGGIEDGPTQWRRILAEAFREC